MRSHGQRSESCECKCFEGECEDQSRMLLSLLDCLPYLALPLTIHLRNPIETKRNTRSIALFALRTRMLVTSFDALFSIYGPTLSQHMHHGSVERGNNARFGTIGRLFSLLSLILLPPLLPFLHLHLHLYPIPSISPHSRSLPTLPKRYHAQISFPLGGWSTIS